MSKKFKGFERIRKAMAMGAAGTVGLLGFGIGTGRANDESITVTNAITAGTSYKLVELSNSSVSAAEVLVSTATVSTDVGESGSSSGNPTIQDTTNAYGIHDARINNVSHSWSGLNYSSVFGSGFDTSDDLNDAFDSYGGIFVDGAPYNDLDGNVDVTGNSVTTHARPMPDGLVVSSQYYAFSNKRLARIIFTINNPTGSTISPRIAIGGNLGSDSTTYVANTSNGNQTVETGDTWVITHDNSVYGGVATNDPILTHIVGGGSTGIRPFPLQIPGGGGQAPVQKSLTSVSIKSAEEKEGDVAFGDGPSFDHISFGYDLVIPAGETQYITWFVQLSASMNETTDSLPDYQDEVSATAAGLFINPPAGMVGGGVNWSASDPQRIPVFSPISLLILSGLFGFAATRRLRKVK